MKKLNFDLMKLGLLIIPRDFQAACKLFRLLGKARVSYSSFNPVNCKKLTMSQSKL